MTMVYQCQWPHMHKCPSPLEPQGLSLPGWGWGSHNPETLLPGGGGKKRVGRTRERKAVTEKRIKEKEKGVLK